MSRPLRVLFVGDVVGPRAVEWLAARLPGLRCEHAVDAAIVDAENCSADGVSIVEMHALSVMAKQSLAYALDGHVAAVLGTHTHEPTLDLHVLSRGTVRDGRTLELRRL